MGIIMHCLPVYFCSSIYYCSNSLVLVKVVLENKMEDVPSWRAAETVKKCIQACTRNWHKLIIRHGPRKAVQTPHNMANWARRTGKTATGTPIQCQLVHLDIEHRLSTTYFSRAAEEQV